VLQRPDPHSFSRFLASIGFFLCIAAFVGPGIVLRETSTLEFKRSDLAELTDVGKKELERRQEVARDVAQAAPRVGIVAFIAGVGLLIYAAPKMRRQELTEEERSEAELAHLRKQLPPATEAERGARAEEEVAAEVAFSEVPNAGAVGAPKAQVEPMRVQRYMAVERRVLDRIAATAPPLYELKAEVRLAPSGTLIDGVLVSMVDQIPDVVIEIKLRRPNVMERFVRSSIDETLARLARYRAVAASNAIGWLILVSDGEVPTDIREKVEILASEVEDDVRVSLVTEKEIDELRLPPGKWQ
jgi:hypothetical protein